VGCANSELCSIEEDCLCEIRLPDAPEPAIALRGIWDKGSRSNKGSRTQWVCGPLGAQVIKVLMSLTANNRKLVGTKKLFVATDRSWDLRHQSGEFRPDAGSDHMWRLRLSSFMERFGLRNSKGDLWHLRTHQFRRTFARMVARWTDCPLVSLQLHLKHLKRAHDGVLRPGGR